jgi:iron complex outermembrane receptor protein
MLRLVCAVCAAAFLSQALAQDDDAVVVTATRFPDAKRDLPVGVTVITAADIQKSASSNLAEILAQFGLVHIRDNSGSPNQSVDLRGFGITGDQNTLLLVDGIRISENELSTAQLTSVPLESIERIEVVRGSGAVQYGSGASGGTINIITRRLRPGETRGNLLGRVGGYGTREVRAGYGRMNESTGLSLDVSQEDTVGYRRHNQYQQTNVAGLLDWRDGARRTFLRIAYARQGLDLPGALTEAQIKVNPRQQGAFLGKGDREDVTVTLGGSWRGEGHELSADLAYRDKNATAVFLPAFVIDTRVGLVSVQPRGKWKFDALGRKHDLTAGVDVESWDYESRNPFATTDGLQRNGALYAAANFWATDSTRLVTGLRLQQSEQRLGPNNEDFNLHAAELALRQHFGDAWSVYGKFGTSFRLATFDEVCFVCLSPLLQPQQSRGGELATEYARGGTRLRLAAHAQRLRNEIYFSPLVPPFGANINLSPTERRGLELEGATRLTASLDWRASYALQQATFRSGVYGGTDVTGKTVPLVPRRIASTGLSWAATARDRVNLSVRYVDKQYYDNDQANRFSRTPSYALIDLKLDRSFRRNLRGAIEVRNLLDKDYYSYGIWNGATSFSAYPQAQRALYLTLAASL